MVISGGLSLEGQLKSTKSKCITAYLRQRLTVPLRPARTRQIAWQGVSLQSLIAYAPAGQTVCESHHQNSRVGIIENVTYALSCWWTFNAFNDDGVP